MGGGIGPPSDDGPSDRDARGGPSSKGGRDASDRPPPGDPSFSRRDSIRAGAGLLGGSVVGCIDVTAAIAGKSVTATARTPTSEPEATQHRPVDVTDMELAFEDRFESCELDESRWWDKYPWDARTHNYNGFAAPENAYVENGRLVLKAEDREMGEQDYTTGVVSPREVFKPGYYAARIKVPPHVPGFWPAFWLTSASYHPPEIDIFEFFGKDPRAYMTYHYANDEGRKETVRKLWGSGFADDFHTYSVDWRPPERIVWYIDGVERFRYDGEHVSGEYCYLILNFGIDRPGDPPPRSADLPATYEVDWVRGWER